MHFFSSIGTRKSQAAGIDLSTLFNRSRAITTCRAMTFRPFSRYNARMGLLLITCAAFGFIMLIMAVGVIFKGRCLRGSCGGQAVFDADGEMLNCAHCPAREEMEHPGTSVRNN